MVLFTALVGRGDARHYLLPIGTLSRGSCCSTQVTVGVGEVEDNAPPAEGRSSVSCKATDLVDGFKALNVARACRRLKQQGCPVDVRLPKLFYQTSNSKLCKYIKHPQKRTEIIS